MTVDDLDQWINRRIERLRSRIEGDRSEIELCDLHLKQLSGLLSEAVASKDYNEETVDLADEFSGYLRDRLTASADSEEFSKLLARLESDPSQVKDRNRDVDGACRYGVDRLHFGETYPDLCGQPTVYGTRWCAMHEAKWCDRCGRHLTGSTAKASKKHRE
ncbi:hypothetical protein [Bifidobacterium sp. SO1]|uniref:hypothetical protein n=1 Tax=Bifidobacterium sp. SO1 TaxID=2809029 RepID=UPI001BDBFE50|nr:hypothetical protein [Bifidobacterium sp. SO1]MBT1162211.1 hypothetical protein [Bifidobacterium sp. SO1]